MSINFFQLSICTLLLNWHLTIHLFTCTLAYYPNTNRKACTISEITTFTRFDLKTATDRLRGDPRQYIEIDGDFFSTLLAALAIADCVLYLLNLATALVDQNSFINCLFRVLWKRKNIHRLSRWIIYIRNSIFFSCFFRTIGRIHSALNG